jgi:DNA polymerase-3 subunit epsilon/CBS domain-containing protein
LGVTDADRRLIGAVTTRDLLRHRATTAIVLGDEIDHAADAGALGLAFAKVPQVAASLLADAIPARQVAAVISAEICATTARAAQLAESAMAAAGEGPPPQPYAVLVLGSAGRGESQLAPDQDNAIVYADGAEGGDADRWFEAMATRMNAILDVAGIPFCKGGVMAKNRAWRKSLADWTATVDGWVRRQRPADLLSVDIFFDAVAVHGERSFAERLWNHAYARAHAARDFQNLLVESARHPAPAFTLFGGFRVDTGGRLDLKKTGLMPMFTAARVLSIRHDVRRRSSADRLIGAAAAGGLTPEVADSLIAAQETLLATVLGQQLIDREAGLPPTPRAVPARLDAPARERLREALKLVPTAVDLAAEGRI